MADEDKNVQNSTFHTNGWFKEHFFELAFTTLCTVILALAKDDASQRELRITEYKSFYETLKNIYTKAADIPATHDTIFVLRGLPNGSQRGTNIP